jgi:serine/threonine-protein kinase RsbW
MGGRGEVIRLKVPCSLEYKDLALRVVSAACSLVRERKASGGRADGERDFDHQVVSGFAEAFNNVVLHGRRGAEGEELEIEIEPLADRLQIRLLDNGESFDLSAVPAPDLEALPESGLGVHIIRSSMDEVSYASGSPNVLSMTRRLGEFSQSDDGEETVLRISGILDAVTAPDIRSTIERLIEERRTPITVDLSALRLIDSSGVGVIVSLYKRSKEFGGTVRVAGLKDQPLAIFRLLKLDRVFRLS